MEVTTQRPRLPALTSLRFFAALHVVFFHLLAFKVLWSQGWLKQLSSIGYVGVSFFFVLSGFILVYTYSGRDTSVRDFYRARFARIYPAFAFSLLLTAPFFFYAVLKLNIPFFAWTAAHLKLSIAMVLLLLQAWVPLTALSWNSVAWSLSDEAFFYAGFPFLQRRFATLSALVLVLMAAACWAASLAITVTYVIKNPDRLPVMDADVLNSFWMNFVKFHPLARLPEFLLGMACGALFLKSKHDSRLALPLVLGGLLAGALAAAYSAKLPYPVLHTSLLAPAFAAIIYGVALRPRWSRMLELKPLEFLGDASYSVYLIHASFIGPFFYTMTGGVRHRTYSWIFLYLITVVAIASLIYRFIEQPLRRKLRGSSRPKLAASPAEPQTQTALA